MDITIDPNDNNSINGLGRIVQNEREKLVSKEMMKMDAKEPVEYDRYTAADLSPELLQRIVTLEEEIKNATEKDVVLIAYEESQHNPT